MALLILALLQRIFLMSSLMLLLVWLIFFMVLIKLLPILGTISGKTVKLMVLALICLSLVSWIKHSVDRFVIVSIFIPKLRLILILNSFLGSSDSLVFSELFHSLAPRPLAARSISDFLLTYLAT